MAAYFFQMLKQKVVFFATFFHSPFVQLLKKEVYRLDSGEAVWVWLLLDDISRWPLRPEMDFGQIMEIGAQLQHLLG
jgi:hypothetical protein